MANSAQHAAGVNEVVYSPDGTHLLTTTDQPPAAAAGEDAAAQLWDLDTGIRYSQPARPFASGLALNKAGTRFAIGGYGGFLKIRNTATGSELLNLTGHTSTVSGVAFSPEERLLATSSIDDTVRIWDTETGKEVLTLTGHTGPVMSVSFSPDGTRLAASGQDGTVRIYLLRIEDLVAQAKSRLTRSLTTEECQKYLHTEQGSYEP